MARTKRRIPDWIPTNPDKLEAYHEMMDLFPKRRKRHERNEFVIGSDKLSRRVTDHKKWLNADRTNIANEIAHHREDVIAKINYKEQIDELTDEPL